MEQKGIPSSEHRPSSDKMPCAAATTLSNSEAPLDVPMRYISPAEVKASLDETNGAYLVVDVRKGADYEAGHLPNSVSIDVDAAKRGDYAAGTRAVKAGMKEATGSENGGGATIALVCYTGRRCAQAATNILSALGAPADKVLTIEGGMEAWRAAYPDVIEVW